MNLRIAKLILPLVFLASLAFGQAPAKKIKNVTANDVRRMINTKQDIILLDVRTPMEFNGPLGHIKGAKLIPLQVLAEQNQKLNKFKDKKIVVYCRSGNRSVAATSFLLQKGFNVVNMLGGMRAWNALPKMKIKP